MSGSTILFAAHWQRNMPSDFCVRTLDGVADDWPLTYKDLEPFYERVANVWLDRVSAARPDLAAGLKDILCKMHGREAAEVAATLRTSDAAD